MVSIDNDNSLANSVINDKTTMQGKHRLTKNEKRRLRKKDNKNTNNSIINTLTNSTVDSNITPNVQIEYVSASIDDNDAILEQFKDIFQKFAKPEELTSDALGQQVTADPAKNDTSSLVVSISNENKISNKKKKLSSRLTVAELKQLVPRADIVEAHDVTSSDPRLLVFVKAYRNTVPIPRHWCHKRKYLQGKRGIEKLPFKLPDFIADTGIAKIRDSILERDALKRSKQKARDKMKPAMGKIDIDYQVLHDAFFKFQTKCKVTNHGDLYYEGREFEVGLLQDKKPGNLSIELKNSLAITSELSPPPWLINMQRYGPPPSYPSMRIPGLNAPIPKRADFGYHTGGWGKPPVDEYGRPLYGDVFGTSSDLIDVDEGIDKNSRWGYFVPLEKLDDEESDEEEDANVEGDDMSKDDMSGIATPSTLDGMSSVITGVETPDVINLRKNTGQETPVETSYKELYHVLEEKTIHTTAGQFYSSDRVYELPPSDASIPDEQLKDNDQKTDGKSKNDEDTSKSKRKRKSEENSAVKKIKEFKF